MKIDNIKATRRSFLKGVSALSVGVPLFGMNYTFLDNHEVDFKPKPSVRKSEFHYVTCPRNCRDACSLIAEVQDGIMIDIKGAKNHPVTQGTACVKGDVYREYLYQPNRLLYPMKRVGKRKEGKWERISWDEAYSLVGIRLNKIIKQYGGEAIGEILYSGNEGYISKQISPGNLMEKIGATRLVKNPCDWPRYIGTPSVIGTSFSKDLLESKESDLYVSWGSNEAYTAVHWARYGQDVRRINGGKLIVINSVRIPMANNADMFIQLKPSSDPSFCLGVCKVLIEENLYDKKFVEKYCIGFEDLVKEVKEYTLEKLAADCEITKEEIIEFARIYAAAKKPCLVHGDGGQRHFNGARLVRAVTFLPVLVGSLTKRGGGLFWANVNLQPCFNFNSVMPNLSPKDKDGKVIKRQTANYVQFGRALRLDNPTSLDTDSQVYKEVKLHIPLRAVINFNTSMMTTCPNTELIKKRLMEDDDFFLVVLDPFHTDTVDYADVVLPAGTFLESEDIQNDQISGWLCYNSAAANLVGESKTNLEIFNGIARAMGYKDECFTCDDHKVIIKKLIDTPFNRAQNITYERLVREGQIKPVRNAETMKDYYPYYPYSPDDNLVFMTPSKKIELYSKAMKDWGFNPVIDLGNDWDYYKASKEFGKDYLAKYPIYFMTPGVQLQDNTNWGSNKYILPRVLHDGYPEIFMNKDDAAKRGLETGSIVEASNEKGKAYFRVNITSQLQSGVSYAWKNLWTRTTKTVTGANILCSDGISDLGQGSTYSATFIEIKKQ